MRAWYPTDMCISNWNIRLASDTHVYSNSGQNLLERLRRDYDSASNMLVQKA